MPVNNTHVMSQSKSHNENYIVEMLGIRKEFSGIVANDEVSLQVEAKSIHALLGENGSGKSTLMSILFGLLNLDEGEIYLRGKKVHINNPLVANKLGIGMVHQHFQLIETFTVAENIILGIEPKKSFNRIFLKETIKKIEELSQIYNLYIDPHARIKDISVSMQQKVEILKMLYRNAELMIFDEPTAVLVPSEIEELMLIMKSLVQEGKSIILITHKLKEIKQVAKHCTILCRGKHIGTVDVKDTNEQQLAKMMIGRSLSQNILKKNTPSNTPVLKIKDLHAKKNNKTIVNSVSLEVNKGEILGIAGVEGNGQIELFETLVGTRKIEHGEIIFEEKNIEQNSIYERIKKGIGIIPEDRQKYGLIPNFTLSENIILKKYHKNPYSHYSFLNFNAIHNLADTLIDDFDIRSGQGHNSIVSDMSGGNQQKAIIAREIDYSPKLLLVVQPTRGLDIGAIEYIHERLIEERNKGTAVLLISMELDEITKLSDRIAVMYNGNIVKILSAKNIDPIEIGLMMIGKK